MSQTSLRNVKFGFLLAIFVSCGLQASTTTTWPGYINYQGQLTNTGTGALISGSQTIIFSLYTTPTAGSAIWQETDTLTVTNGLFDVVLGTGTLDTSTPLNQLPPSTFTTDLWIGVKVQGDTGEMTPRQQLLPATYARNALSLNGLVTGTAATNIVTLNSNGQIPSNLVGDGAVTAPLDLTSSSSAYTLNLLNTTSGSAPLGLTVVASNGIAAQASNTSGYGVLGQTSNPDSAAAVGVRGSASSGTGVVAQSVSGIGLSVTTQSTNPAQPSIYAAGLYPESISVATSPANGIGLSLGDGVSQSVNLLDRKDSAGLWASTTGSGIFGVSATAASSTGVFGLTDSNVATDYGVWGVNLGTEASAVGVNGVGYYGVMGTSNNSAGYGVRGVNNAVGAGSGTRGLGFIGVNGLSNQNGGTGVQGSLGSAVTSGIGVLGTVGSNVANGTGVAGSSSGTAGVGVSGYATDANGVGVFGIQGASNPNSTTVTGSGNAAGVFGTTLGLAVGTGVLGQGNFALMGESSGWCAVCGYSTNPAQFDQAGYFQITESGNNTFYGVRASAQPTVLGGANNGTNFFSDPTGDPEFGFYHADPVPTQANRIGMFSLSACQTCYAGYFSNISATSGAGIGQDGAALSVQGRIQVGANTGAGTFTTVYPTNTTSYTLSSNFIPQDGNCLIFLTSATPGNGSVASVTVNPGSPGSSGTATITFSPALSGPVTYQYLIIGQ